MVARSDPAASGGTVTEAGGMDAAAAAGATRPLSSNVRPRYPAPTAATPTAPARTRNDRRDQSGIRATDVLARPSPTAVDGATPFEWSSSQPRTHKPSPIEIAALAPETPGLVSGASSDATNPTTPKATNTPADTA